MDLARRLRVPLPERTLGGLTRRLTVSRRCRSLGAFLRKFELLYPLLPHAQTIERIAYELCEDQARDGVVYFETRYAPVLASRPGFSIEDSILAALAGLRRGGERWDIQWGLILCLYLGAAAESSLQTVRLAAKYRDRGVVGIDLAGDEPRFPVAPQAAALDWARTHGIPITLHAGEAGRSENIEQAVVRYGARRIGHGVALARDRDLALRLVRKGVTLECCLTSNLQTGSVPSLKAHPFRTFQRWGVPVTLNTDDPAISRISLSGELARAARAFGLSRGQILDLQRVSLEASFAPDAVKRRAVKRVNAWTAAMSGWGSLGDGASPCGLHGSGRR
jgi:adenosine deaminase